MTRIAHLSDLHFGRVDGRVADAVADDVRRFDPHLVVVSGDLTQRAKPAEFVAARAFLDRLKDPRVVVPGNHDIPLFNLVWRFLFPLRRWRRYVGEDLSPFHQGDGVTVLGINTARSFTWKNGRVSAEQMQLIRERLCPVAPGSFKIVVTHHPFLPSGARKRGAVVGRADEAMRALDACRVDMILSGHLHVSEAAATHAFYRIENHSALMIQAGTATSNRTRTEKNSYNAITIEEGVVTIVVRRWNGSSFASEPSQEYARVDGLWSRRGAAP